jgi:hypothetical protein
MRTTTEWAEHPQGRAVAAEPLVHVKTTDVGSVPRLGGPIVESAGGPESPGPDTSPCRSCGDSFPSRLRCRVLRIDPPGWDGPGVVPEVTLGKRCARLDLHRWRRSRDLRGVAIRRATYCYTAIVPVRSIIWVSTRSSAVPYRRGLIDVCLDAYGWSGPWASRRGSTAWCR